MRFDAEQGMLAIMPALVDGGITPNDVLWNAAMQEMNFQFSGQDETGAWKFHGTFALSSEYGKLSLESELDELRMVDPRDGYFELNRGNASDGSQGGSPWMNKMFAMLAGHAPTGLPNTMFGAPVLWYESAADPSQLSNGFTVSTPWIPVQLTLWPSLVEFEAHETPGDYNGDGEVNAADRVVLRKTMGQTGSGLLADGNGDGVVDLADGDVWSGHFGETAHLGAAATNGITVPEPASVLLLLFAAGLGIRERRRATAATIFGS
jgi:hypothetical protein